jgi:dihydroxyacetone synthase
MASISNGLAAYNPGTIIPVTSSFFMFYLVSVVKISQNGSDMKAVRGTRCSNGCSTGTASYSYSNP